MATGLKRVKTRVTLTCFGQHSLVIYSSIVPKDASGTAFRSACINSIVPFSSDGIDNARAMKQQSTADRPRVDGTVAVAIHLGYELKYKQELIKSVGRSNAQFRMLMQRQSYLNSERPSCVTTSGERHVSVSCVTYSAPRPQVGCDAPLFGRSRFRTFRTL
jgi:hypothetical protein